MADRVDGLFLRPVCDLRTPARGRSSHTVSTSRCVITGPGAGTAPAVLVACRCVRRIRRVTGPGHREVITESARRSSVLASGPHLHPN